MRITELDPADADFETRFDAWFDVLDDASRSERPGELQWTREEFHALLVDGRADDPDEARVALAAHDGDGVVGAGVLELPMRDNRHVASVNAWVPPAHRRRGVATALLEELTARAKDDARSTLICDVDEPPHQRGSSPGRLFAQAHGFEVVLVDVRRDLGLPVPEERLRALEEGARPHAEGYRVLTWRGRVPDELLDDRAELGRRMSTDVPLGDLDWQEEVWDGARVRREEDLWAREGQSVVAAGAVDERTGRMVAYTDLGLSLAVPERVFQWNTIVLPEHRGHRLGTLVKVATAREVSRLAPGARYVSTWNATSNRHMIAVNEALGFRVNGEMLSVQRAL